MRIPITIAIYRILVFGHMTIFFKAAVQTSISGRRCSRGWVKTSSIGPSSRPPHFLRPKPQKGDPSLTDVLTWPGARIRALSIFSSVLHDVGDHTTSLASHCIVDHSELNTTKPFSNKDGSWTASARLRV